MAVKPKPEGYQDVTPYLCIKGAAKAIDFYKEAFGAVEAFRMNAPDGSIGHAEIKIGESTLMLSEECEEGEMRSPQSVGGSTIGLHVYVQDVDSQFSQAVNAGAKVLRPVKDQFYGDRTGSLEDPFGYVWFLATHTEDLSPEEIGKRAEAMFSQGG